MGPIEKLFIALEADDIDILAPDAEKQAFGEPNNKNDPKPNSDSSNTDEKDVEVPKDLNDDTNENIDDSEMNTDGEDEDELGNDGGEEEIQEPEDESRIKTNTRIKLKYLYDIVSSNLDKLVSLDHEIKSNDIEKYSKIQSKFTDLKTNLYKFLTDDEYLSKDCATYTKYYITSKELYNLCIQMTDIFFQEYKVKKEDEKANNKQKYKDNK